MHHHCIGPVFNLLSEGKECGMAWWTGEASTACSWLESWEPVLLQVLNCLTISSLRWNCVFAVKHLGKLQFVQPPQFPTAGDRYQYWPQHVGVDPHPLQDIAGSSFSCRDETCSWSEGWKTLCCSAHKDKNFSTSGEYHVLKAPILIPRCLMNISNIRHPLHCACTGHNLHLHHVWKTS